MIETDGLPTTLSLCPECLEKIEAHYRLINDTVYLEKTCPVHGTFQTPVWQGGQGFRNWVRPKIPVKNRFNMTGRVRGCPFDCGLCPDHCQQTCTAVLEVTGRCNFHCTFCFARSGPGNPDPDPDLGTIRKLLETVQQASPGCNLQLSGGEPTLREDLPDIIRIARETGFEFVQVNTNGYLLAKQPGLARRLKAAGLSSVFLQFDGMSDDVYTQLRGHRLLAEKQAAVAHCIKNRIGVILVPTLVPGINVNEIGPILAFGLENAPGIRGVHFQPVSHFGRIPGAPADTGRLTIPEILGEIASQTRGKIRRSHFHPSSCEHALCSFSSKFMITENRDLSPLAPFPTECCGPSPAEQGAGRAKSSVARQWRAPPEIQQPAGPGSRDGLDRFIRRAATHIFSISGMAFQDAWNLDLERLKGCCIHSVAPGGRLIPFCAYNLTSANGKGLYRTP